VENPDVDSKTASINDGMVPLNKYGIEPRIENTIHDNVTDRYPSLLLNLPVSAFRETKYSKAEIAEVISDDQRNGNGDSL
jgi:hypothetical protein